MKVFVKSRRAKDKDDYETWVEHGTANTLNTFEGGDVRATTLIVKDEDRANGIGIEPKSRNNNE